MNAQTKILYRFTINGKEYIEKDFSLNQEDNTQEKLVNRFHEFVKEKIAVKIISESLKVILAQSTRDN